MFYLLTYITAEDYLERRTAFRERHLSLAKSYYEKGLLILGGALANPPDKALLLFKCDNKTPIENFIENDPYVQNGLVISWEIREWTIVVGGE